MSLPKVLRQVDEFADEFARLTNSEKQEVLKRINRLRYTAPRPVRVTVRIHEDQHELVCYEIGQTCQVRLGVIAAAMQGPVKAFVQALGELLIAAHHTRGMLEFMLPITIDVEPDNSNGVAEEGN